MNSEMDVTGTLFPYIASACQPVVELTGGGFRPPY